MVGGSTMNEIKKISVDIVPLILAFIQRQVLMSGGIHVKTYLGVVLSKFFL